MISRSGASSLGIQTAHSLVRALLFLRHRGEGGRMNGFYVRPKLCDHKNERVIIAVVNAQANANSASRTFLMSSEPRDGGAEGIRFVFGSLRSFRACSST
jgi:hypothetical protein